MQGSARKKTMAAIFAYGDPIWKKCGFPMKVNIPGPRKTWVYYRQGGPIVRVLTGKDILSLPFSDRNKKRRG